MPMKDESRRAVSLGEIARLAGVSRMTVSLALRNESTRVSKKTRTTVLRIARKLHYAPDARINASMSLIRGARKKESLPIAWLNTSLERDAWTRHGYLSPYFEGAKIRSAELGYELHDFWIREPKMTSRRISEILYHRGIRGVIICPPPELGWLGHIRLNWDYFATVSFEKGFAAPSLPRVAQDHHYNMTLALKMLRRRGFRRIAVFLSAQTDRRSYHTCHAAVDYFQSKLPPAQRIPVFVHLKPDSVDRSFFDWMKKFRPDVVVGQHSQLIQWIEEAGFLVPDEVGCVHLSVDDDCTEWTGIWSRKREIGRMTVDAVVSMTQNNLFGLQKVVGDTLIRGRWHPGGTLQKL